MSNRQKPVGVLMLDTNFPRPPGDIGNPATFEGRVIYARVPAATVANVVTDGEIQKDVCAAFLAAARSLIDAGAGAITTSCGFLSVLQDELDRQLPVPVVTSALCLLPQLRAEFGEEATIGILTFDADKLGSQHIPDAGPYVVEGLGKNGELFDVISRDKPVLDEAKAEAETVAAVRRLLRKAPGAAAIVLECTNLPPYRRAIESMTRIPVYDIRDAIAMPGEANAHA